MGIPAADQYTALDKGTVAAIFWPRSGELEQYAFQEVVDYYTITGGMNTVAMGYNIINKDAWNQLTKKEQEMSDEISAQVLDKFAEWIPKGFENTEALLKGAGVEFFEFSDADSQTMLKLAEPLGEEWAKDMDGKGHAGTKVWNYWSERILYWETH